MSETDAGRVEMRRKVEVGIRIGADSWESALHALRHLEFLFAEKVDGGETFIDTVSGGPDAGTTMIADEDPVWTHDHYFAEIDKWLAERRKAAPVSRSTEQGE